MIYSFFNQPYQLTIPAAVQVVIISMIQHDMIGTKDMLETVRLKLTEAYKNPQTQAWMEGFTKTSDVKEFHQHVTSNKDHLYALCGLSNTTAPTRT
jgi:hypothetical protein